MATTVTYSPILARSGTIVKLIDGFGSHWTAYPSNYLICGRNIYTGNNYEYRGYASFDTSGLPARIEVLDRQFYVSLFTNVAVTGPSDWKTYWTVGENECSNPLTTADWHFGLWAGQKDWTVNPVTGWVTLNSSVSKQVINESGRTDFEIRDSSDYTTPCNYQTYWYNAGRDECKLKITYRKLRFISTP